MPRFFLNVYYASSCSEDQDGELFDNPTLALDEARLVMKELLIESIRSGSERVPRRVGVLDDQMRPVGAVQVADVIAGGI